MKSTRFEDFLAQQLKNPAVKKEYDVLHEEFETRKGSNRTSDQEQLDSETTGTADRNFSTGNRPS